MSADMLTASQLAGQRGGRVSAGLRQKVRRLRKLNPALAPTIKASTQDIVFAAGFYEGDGSCSKQPGNSMRMGASQKDREILDWLRDRFGGGVYPRRKNDVNSLFQWIISGARARGFAQSIYGLLSTRRKKQLLDLVGDFR